MSERLATEIWIGGKVRRRTARRLCQVIGRQNVSLEWGDAWFRPSEPEELLAALEAVDGTQLLRLCDEQAPWGQLEALEAFLVRNRIPFRRHSEGKYEYDPQIVEYRPGRKLVCLNTNHSGESLVPLAVIRQAQVELHHTVASLRRGELSQAKTALRRVLKQLQDQLPPRLPRLPTFDVI